MIYATLPNGVSSAATVQALPAISVYDMTARLTTVAWETGADDRIDCPIISYFCATRRPFTGAALSGTVSYSHQDYGVSSRLTGSFCNAFSIEAPNGCTGVANMVDAPYAGNGHSRAATAPFDTELIAPKGPYSWSPGDPWSDISFTNVVATADSVYGDIVWYQSYGRFPPQHAGTFVARERR